MDAETIRNWLQAVNMLGTFFLGVWLYLEKRSDRTNDSVGHLADKVEALDKAVSTLEATAEAAPKHADLAKIHEAINGLSGQFNRLVGENHVQSETLRLIHEYMMRGGR